MFDADTYAWSATSPAVPAAPTRSTSGRAPTSCSSSPTSRATPTSGRRPGLRDRHRLGVGPDRTRDLALVAPTFTLSGDVTSGATPVSGHLRLRLRRHNVGLRRGRHDGPRGRLHDRLPPGAYKPYVQTNTPAYPDQYIGGSGITTATLITVSADTTRDLDLVAPPTFTLSGAVKSGATPVSGTFVYLFDANTSAYVGAATMGPGAAYTIDLAAGFPTRPTSRPTRRLYPDQYIGGSSIATATVITVSADTTRDLDLVAS